MQHPDEGTIHAWIDGALPPAEAAALEAHVAACAECSAAVAEARGMLAAASRILSALDDVPGGVIPAAAPADATRVARGRASAAEVRPFRFRAARWQVAAGLMVAVAGSWLVLRNDGARDTIEIKAADTSVAGQASAVSSERDTLAGAMERVAEVAPSAEGLAARGAAPRAGRPGSRTESSATAPVGTAFRTGSGGKAAVGGAAGGSTTAGIGDIAGVLRGVDVSSASRSANKVAAEEALAQVQATAAAAPTLDSVLAADSMATARMAMRLEELVIVERPRVREQAERRQVAPAPAAPPVASRAAAADAAPQFAQSRLPESARSALGCYEVSVGPWSAPVDSASAALVPRWLRLTDEGVPGVETGSAWAVRAVPGMPAFPDGASASWTALGPDQIRVRVNAGGRLAVMTLAVSPDVLRGRLRVTASDGTTPIAGVTARRASCPTTVPSR